MGIQSKCWIDDDLQAHVQLSVDLADIEELRDRDAVMQEVENNLTILEVLKSRDEIEYQIGVALYDEQVVSNVPEGKRIGHKIMNRLICRGTNLESLRKAITEVQD